MSCSSGCHRIARHEIPVERLWEDWKYRIDVSDAFVRSNLKAFREHIAGIIRSYTAEAMTSLTGYAYLVEAAYAL